MGPARSSGSSYRFLMCCRGTTRACPTLKGNGLIRTATPRASVTIQPGDSPAMTRQAQQGSQKFLFCSSICLAFRPLSSLCPSKVLQRSHAAVIRVYDKAGNMIETHEHADDFKEWYVFARITS